MPELPEVEVVTKSLDKIISGKTIIAGELRRQRLAPDCTPIAFTSMLSGSLVNFVHRRGKHILFDLDNGRTLITHLRMSGRFMHLPLEADDPKFAHAVFHLEGDTKLVFDDQRHFGLMKIVETALLSETESIKRLAPEPFSDDFSKAYLRAALRLSRRSLKEFLLDQTKVCGLGNIYAAEVMFLSRVHPEQPANTVSGPRSAVLHEKIREVLNEAMLLGSTLSIDETNIGGSIYGTASDSEWRVYDREGHACGVCEKPIRRIRQAGRSTYFCVRCQRKRAGAGMRAARR